jgi:hypothetical protein
MPGRIPLNFRDRAGAWAEFARRHEENPFLDLDPLYPLPEKLIDAIIHYTSKGRGFFTEDEVTFERDLARLERGGPDQKRAQAQRRRQRTTIERKRWKIIKSRIEAYSGWLVTNPQFRAERDALRHNFGEQVQIRGGFPSNGRTDRRWCGRTAEVDAPLQAFRAF